MTLLEAQQHPVDFPAHPNTTLGAIVAQDVSYLDFLAGQGWLDWVTADAVRVLCEHHGRTPKSAPTRSDRDQLSLAL